MSDLERTLEEALEMIEREGLARTLEPGGGIDFTSNDYLGLSASPGFREKVLCNIDREVLSEIGRAHV